jgi:uncharacterized protein with HEPN domain
MKKSNPYLRHILEECEYLEKSSKGLKYEDFFKDETLKRANKKEVKYV